MRVPEFLRADLVRAAFLVSFPPVVAAVWVPKSAFLTGDGVLRCRWAVRVYSHDGPIRRRTCGYIAVRVIAPHGPGGAELGGGGAGGAGADVMAGGSGGRRQGLARR
eukprot:1182432-Prorocentrum_minimum.AAC.1